MNPRLRERARLRLHRLVDGLPDAALNTAERVLEALRVAEDPVFRALRDAPEEEHPISEEERAALEEAEEAVRQGDVMPLKEYLAERED